MKKKKTNPLVGHFTFACLALAAIWMFVIDKDTLVVLNSLVLVYVVFALGRRLMQFSNKKPSPPTSKKSK
ncbi:hypothetical protein [Pseudoalteromonas sp. PS5]|uniref:hypothetical protein n=1 Tax=Pseudoalteromonas sp. PS5 TaxID=1437473 RepID=UPI000FFE3A86|nr:hypothetical protein [Pseudoalteromonas sp. PS5]RXF01871.1 hypothetical protein D9603_12270 [Pseudoalteromonas sp. PS5]